MKKTVIFIMLLLLSFTASALVPEEMPMPAEVKYANVDFPTSGVALRTLAIRKGIVPKDPNDEYVREQLLKGNSVTPWIILTRKDKIECINGLKELFKTKKSTIITDPAEKYVDIINGTISYYITKETITSTENLKGVGWLFKIAAEQNNDLKQVE